MRFEHDEAEWRIRFKHTDTRTTFAYLELWNKNTQQWQLFTYGSTICGKSDRFEKEVGRKIALERLTKKIGEKYHKSVKKKDIRVFKSKIWSTYINRPRPKAKKETEDA